MDLNDIWQQHKVWILGCLAGLVVFVVANGFIGSQFDTSTSRRTVAAANAQIARGTWYGSAEQTKAREDQTKLDAALAAVEERTYFKLRPPFDLEGKGDPTLHYLSLTTDIRTKLRDKADAASVDYSAVQVGLPAQSPVDRTETQLYLVGLDLIDDALERLLAASEAVRLGHPEAHGLRSVDKIQMEVRAKAAEPRRAVGVARRTQEVDIGERVGVRCRFWVDGVTLQVFLESLLGGDGRRPLLLEEIDAKNVGKPGEPLEVECKFLALLKPNA